jgi:hypothetical protein
LGALAHFPGRILRRAEIQPRAISNMSNANDTQPPMTLSERTPLRMPLSFQMTMLAAVAAAAVAYGTARVTLSDHTERIAAIEKEQATTREIVIRIDENVKRLIRDEDRRR